VPDLLALVRSPKVRSLEVKAKARARLGTIFKSLGPGEKVAMIRRAGRGVIKELWTDFFRDEQLVLRCLAEHQLDEGIVLEIARSKVVNVPLSDLYAAWESPTRRSKWLARKPLKIRTATKNKSMRLDWVDGGQILSVNFYSKGKDKSQVALQHGKLPDARAAEKAKVYWGNTLETLKAYVER